MPQRKPPRIALDLRGLTGRSELWRFPQAVQRDPAVDAWFAAGPVELKSIAQEWFRAMRRCGSDIRQLIHDGCPVACVEDAAFAYVNSFKSHVNVGFFHGAELEDPSGLLEGSGKSMRHVKLRPGSAIDTDALRDLLRAAYADVKVRLDTERSGSR